MVKPKVAKATEGAAPKIPAKLLGLKTSPITAKAVTNKPPMMKRMAMSPKSSPYNFRYRG